MDWPAFWQTVGDFVAGFGEALMSANVTVAPVTGWEQRQKATRAPWVSPGTDTTSDAYAAGKVTGDVVAVAQGLAEMGNGATMVGGGGLCAAFTGGGCAPVTAGAVVAGTLEFAHGATVAGHGATDLAMFAQARGKNSAGDSYPSAKDPRTGRNIPKPTGNMEIIPKESRMPWGPDERGAFIKEWFDRGYATPEGGWNQYDIHHIQPREYGGTNDFWNLVPVKRDVHRLFNRYWERFP